MRPPPRSTRTYPLFPYPTLIRSLDLCHEAAGDRQGGDRAIPRIAASGVQRVRVEVDAGTGLLADARGQPRAGVGEGALPLRDPPVVEAVGADDPARGAERGDFFAPRVGQRRGGGGRKSGV